MNRFVNKICSLLNKYIRRTVWYNSLWKGAQKIQKLNTFGLQVVNTGSGSGAHAFIYDGLPVKGFNFALPQQSLVHDFNILKNYFSYFDEGCVVLLSVCPFSSMVVNYPSEHNFRYYTILHPATISNFKEEDRTRAYKLYLNPAAYYPSLCIKSLIHEWMSKIASKIRRKSVKKATLKESADNLINGWKRQFAIEDIDSAVSTKHLNDIAIRCENLAEMIVFCIERGFRPVVVMPPMHPSLSEQLSECLLNNYYQPLVNVAIDKNIQYLNYMKDSEFSSDELYETALFLNVKGARQFTKRVLLDLKII